MGVWYYMPASPPNISFDPITKENLDDYRCDSCIKRGCSCNVDPISGIEDTDEQGRFYPCCEYSYDEKGFDK
jgi:hypothetical protein